MQPSADDSATGMERGADRGSMATLRCSVHMCEAVAGWQNDASAGRKEDEAMIEQDEETPHPLHTAEAHRARGALRRNAQVLEVLDAHWQAASRTMLWHRGELPATPAPPGVLPGQFCEIRTRAFRLQQSVAVGYAHRRCERSDTLSTSTARGLTRPPTTHTHDWRTWEHTEHAHPGSAPDAPNHQSQRDTHARYSPSRTA